MDWNGLCLRTTAISRPESNQSRLAQNEKTEDKFLIKELEMMIESLNKVEEITEVKYNKGIIHSELSLGKFSFAYPSGHIKNAEKEIKTQHY